MSTQEQTTGSSKVTRMRTAEERREIVKRIEAAHRSEGISYSELARQEGVPVQQFYNWRSQQNAKKSLTRSSRPDTGSQGIRRLSSRQMPGTETSTRFSGLQISQEGPDTVVRFQGPVKRAADALNRLVG